MHANEIHQASEKIDPFRLSTLKNLAADNKRNIYFKTQKGIHTKRIGMEFCPDWT